jgi:hypothetical protein
MSHIIRRIKEFNGNHCRIVSLRISPGRNLQNFLLECYFLSSWASHLSFSLNNFSPLSVLVHYLCEYCGNQYVVSTTSATPPSPETSSHMQARVWQSPACLTLEWQAGSPIWPTRLTCRRCKIIRQNPENTNNKTCGSCRLLADSCYQLQITVVLFARWAPSSDELKLLAILRAS